MENHLYMVISRIKSIRSPWSRARANHLSMGAVFSFVFPEFYIKAEKMRLKQENMREPKQTYVNGWDIASK